MEARQLIGNGAFSPDALGILFKAFDDAWAEIAPTVGDNVLAQQATRAKLANIILSAATEPLQDTATLKAAALRELAVRGVLV